MRTKRGRRVDSVFARGAGGQLLKSLSQQMSPGPNPHRLLCALASRLAPEGVGSLAGGGACGSSFLHQARLPASLVKDNALWGPQDALNT